MNSQYKAIQDNMLKAIDIDMDMDDIKQYFYKIEMNMACNKLKDKIQQKAVRSTKIYHFEGMI